MWTTCWAATLLAGCAIGWGDPSEPPPRQSVEPPAFFPGDPANHALFAADVSVWGLPIAQSQMDCFWGAGIRHVIVGTQEPLVARQQLAMAVARGMTVDAYVTLYWDVDITAQIDAAFAMTAGAPIGRMWLDVETDPNGTGYGALITSIQEGLTACETRAPGSCGLHAGPDWWTSYLGNTSMFGTTPLWYALLNKRRTLSDWSNERFGGWANPVAKQFQTATLCDVADAGWNVMQVTTTPTVTVDRSLPPDDHQPPPAPGELFPGDGTVLPIDYLKLMSATIPRATHYELALDSYDGTAWTAAGSWTDAVAYETLAPPGTPALYRLHARAENAYGWGAWSDYVTFDYGTYTGRRPGDPPPPPPPPPPPDVPDSLAPDGVTITTASVTLSASAITGATAYQFAIEYQDAGTWLPYYTYVTTTPTKTFSPQYRMRDYRFRVDAMVGGAYAPWSSYATFYVQ